MAFQKRLFEKAYLPMTGPAGRFWLLESALRLLTANLRSDVVFVVNFKWQFNVGITIAEPGNILKRKNNNQ